MRLFYIVLFLLVAVGLRQRRAIVALLSRFEIKSKILEWCGKHLFPLYSYQKLPMLCFASSFIAAHHLLYVFICLTVTLLIAQLYHFWEIKI